MAAIRTIWLVSRSTRQVAPTLEALEALLLTAPAPMRERLSYEDCGEYLRTLWPEEADRLDWQLLDIAERAAEQLLEEKKCNFICGLCGRSFAGSEA